MSKLPTHLIQSIVVPKDHPDVRKSGLEGARRVALRYGAWDVDVADQKENTLRFRQGNPALFDPKSYVSFKSPSGVVVVKAKPLKAVLDQPLEHMGEGCWVGKAVGRSRNTCDIDYEGKNFAVHLSLSRKQFSTIGSGPKTLRNLLRKVSPRQIHLHPPFGLGSNKKSKHLQVTKVRPNPAPEPLSLHREYVSDRKPHRVLAAQYRGKRGVVLVRVMKKVLRMPKTSTYDALASRFGKDNVERAQARGKTRWS